MKSQTTRSRVEPADDQQVAEMIDDPATYFSKVRNDAREEARTYVAERVRSDSRASAGTHYRPKHA